MQKAGLRPHQASEISEKPVRPAADDDHLRKPGIKSLNQLGKASKIGIVDFVAYGVDIILPSSAEQRAQDLVADAISLFLPP